MAGGFFTTKPPGKPDTYVPHTYSLRDGVPRNEVSCVLWKDNAGMGFRREPVKEKKQEQDWAAGIFRPE